MVIFHSYVSLPEGIWICWEMCFVVVVPMGNSRKIRRIRLGDSKDFITKNSDTLGVKPTVIWLKWGMMIPLDAFFCWLSARSLIKLIIDQDWSRLFSACLDTHGSILIILAFPLPIASNFLNELVVFLHGVLPGPQYDSAQWTGMVMTQGLWCCCISAVISALENP